MMTNKLARPKTPKNQRDTSHPGMMGDGTQEQTARSGWRRYEVNSLER
jgi:hypothetical protein